MNTPLVSVVIPTFERTFFLNRAIDSVLKQDYEYIEIIVVVDGKSVETKQLIKEKNKDLKVNIKLIETIEKVGGSEARNIGAQNAKGSYIALLDDDDEWYSDKISSQIDLINYRKLTPDDKFICFTSIYTYKNTNQKKFRKLPLIDYEYTEKKRLANYLFEPKGIFVEGYIQTSSIMVPKKLILRIPFTKGLIKHQDWDWLLKLDKEKGLKVVHVRDPKVIFHSDAPKNKRVGLSNQWRFSEKWLELSRNCFSNSAYESFLLSTVILQIRSDESLSSSEKRYEIQRRLKKLNWLTYFKPFTWKILTRLLLDI
ncbi:Glycosyltransferase, GT2 family [Paenibacillus sophorae]|uniref:Glycosyltransferase family 2 protein n=1 Tax=Paenibacillus sophorae TaxID=1333845 RepID=A0A1H8QHX0_9BACL|nr:glycosyltransferase family A protein [Paenibacillus sophorae]QWU15124.1 glycosyltransferase family 2 protein [Paenibacillus sophorae]SEO53517.1 Glycosyltransferase, GT2 family [Paenibacillus sophorae]